LAIGDIGDVVVVVTGRVEVDAAVVDDGTVEAGRDEPEDPPHALLATTTPRSATYRQGPRRTPS
jgi:hypothetical protein